MNERRAFLAHSCGIAAAGMLALLLPLTGAAQGTSRIQTLRGDVRVNGRRADSKTVVRAGDTVVAGRDGQMVFVLNQDAFFLRANTELRLERQTARDTVISGLRIVSGALGAAFGKGGERRVWAPTVTAGIRGTGVYVEARRDSTYFCTCYGAVELEAMSGGMQEKVFVLAGNHHARLIGPDASRAMRIEEAAFAYHTSEEIIALESAAGRPNPFTTSR